MDETERSLVSRCLAGDASACEAVHAAHAGRVAAYFLRSGFSAGDAEDLVQDTFVRAFRSLDTFDAERGRLGAWLGAIARNVARKSWGRRSAAESFDPELAEEMLAAPEDPADCPEAREETAALRACIEALGGELGRVIRLRYVEGRTTRGIAGAMGIGESTVRARLREAQAQLEECLRKKGIFE